MKNNTSKIAVLVAAVVVLVGLGFWAFTGQDAKAPANQETASGTPQSAAQPNDTDETVDPNQAVSNEATPEAATIVFTSDGFSPEKLEVKLGTVVTVKNESNQRVQFSSDDHPTHRLNEGMNLRTLSPGESGTFTAGPVGTHGFHDHINARYTGTIIVTE